jgi:uncharacterized alkaline shock family protein YloU
MRRANGSGAPALQAEISPEVIETYVVDAASTVPGVLRLGGRSAEERGAAVAFSGEADVEVVVHVLLAAGADGPAVGAEVRSTTAAYLRSMLGLDVSLVTVVVDGAEGA